MSLNQPYIASQLCKSERAGVAGRRGRRGIRSSGQVAAFAAPTLMKQFVARRPSTTFSEHLSFSNLRLAQYPISFISVSLRTSCCLHYTNSNSLLSHCRLYTFNIRHLSNDLGVKLRGNSMVFFSCFVDSLTNVEFLGVPIVFAIKCSNSFILILVGFF